MPTSAIAPLMHWDDSWLIGIYVVDAQHKNLVSILNQLYEATARGHEKVSLRHIVERLMRNTQAHFAAEERLMQDNGYADVVAHKQEHALMWKKMLAFQRDFETGKLILLVDIVKRLGEWLCEHLSGTDANYVPTLHANGVW